MYRLIFYSLIIVFGLAPQLKAQTATIISQQDLPLKIQETSGLALFDETFITHNDSGGSPTIYQFSAQGELTGEVRIEEQKNTDWEDLAQDDNFLYIANTGNNLGKRKKLRILKVKHTFEAPVTAEVIRISYAAQENFTPRKKHPFDSEALTAAGEELLLFSKDRLNLQTDLYRISKTPGNYRLEPELSFDVQSLITGADYDADSKTLALTAYTKQGMQYLYVAQNVDLQALQGIEFQEFIIPLNPAQFEAIKVIDAEHFWVTTEAESKGFPQLLQLSITDRFPMRTIQAN
ncbi:MAG: hypothetical protein ACON42_07045 [Flavobacteriaceae bacterium]